MSINKDLFALSVSIVCIACVYFTSHCDYIHINYCIANIYCICMYIIILYQNNTCI